MIAATASVAAEDCIGVDTVVMHEMCDTVVMHEMCMCGEVRTVWGCRHSSRMAGALASRASREIRSVATTCTTCSPVDYTC